jgi:hypothetical protein
MKKIYCFLCFYLPGIITIYSQNYSPFNGNVPKRFYSISNSVDSLNYFFADSLETLGSATNFYQYHPYQVPEFPIDPAPCFGWGGGGFTITDTTFLGNNVLYENSNQILILINDELDSLKFDFSLNIGDSALFYQNASDLYYIRFDSIQLQTIYTVPDSVKLFTILHFDSIGNNIPSGLNHSQILLGKDLGLLRFINCYNFPVIEEAYQLAGQQNPLVGNYQPTYDDIYPFHIGDSLQFTGADNYNGFYYYNCSYLLTYSIVDRVETATSVTLTFDSWFQWIYKYPPPPWDPPCYGEAPYGSTLTYLKNVDFISKPINYINNDGWPTYLWGMADPSWYLDVNCNNTYGLERVESSEFFCDSCNCMVGADGYGQSFATWNYTPGLGKTYFGNWFYQPDMHTQNLYLSYSNINGIECGNYEWIGIENEIQIDLQLLPNPAIDKVFTNLEFDEVKIYNLQGEVQLNTNLASNEINISSLEAGIYFIQFKIGPHRVIKKLIKIK